jgi:hypothetical protein
LNAVIAPDAAKHQEVFLSHIFGDLTGYLCIACKSGANYFERFFWYPNDIQDALEFIGKQYATHDIYYCAQLLRDQRRIKDNVELCTAAWADLDACAPTNLLVEASIALESSPGRYQALWVLEQPQDAIEVEQLSKRIAYFHRKQGADVSGWDLTQLLRVPLTWNHKYNTIPKPFVKVISVHVAKYRVSDFTKYPPIPSETIEFGPIPDTTNELSADELLQKYQSFLPAVAYELFATTPVEDWSKSLWQLEMLLGEAGMSEKEMFVVARVSRCNKYERDGKTDSPLWKEVQKAYATVQQKRDALRRLTNQPLDALWTDDEAGEVDDSRTIVERYVAWASTQTDAAPAYHHAGALMILSTMLSGSIRLPLRHATLIPNLWFMILGDTTLTRKSTAMRLASGILKQIAPGSLLATDGSVEGLLTNLATRPGVPSLFQRDEFSGLLENMAKKDYYAGMQQDFIKLYDGDHVKRVLRSTTIEVVDPVFILYVGGIREKIYEQLTDEHVANGFVPRFLFYIAESSVDDLEDAELFDVPDYEARDRLIDELREVYDGFTGVEDLRYGEAKIHKTKVWQATATKEALQRWNVLNRTMLKDAQKMDNPTLFLPVFQRLADSTLKTSLLLAAARAPGEPIVIELIDVLQAIKYTRQWRDWACEVMENVGASPFENRMKKMFAAINRKPGISHAEILRSYKINARDVKLFIETLEQRDEIRVIRKGGTANYFPI